MRSDDTSEAVTRCLTAERVPLDVGGVRERVLRTSRMGQQMHEAGSLPSALLSTWLLGQLKVNLRPVWTPAIQSLRSLSEFHEDIVWDKILSELRMLIDGSNVDPAHLWMKSRKTQGHEVKESERTWRDSSYYKLRLSIAKWTKLDSCRDAVTEVCGFCRLKDHL